LAEPSPAAVKSFRRRHGLEGRPSVAFAGRLAVEKGIEVILAALPELKRHLPGLVVLFAGPSNDVVGESGYRERLAPALAAQGDDWRFLGTLDPEGELPAFYAAADCLVLPSLNSTESFGLVQVEAMLCGTPVVASDLPGVRHPVQATGMGEVVPVGDAQALAAAVGRVIRDRGRYVRPRGDVNAALGLRETIDSYERLFESVADGGL
jgi:glycosyltransferase involved in cell wall biosynthesis